MRIPVITGFSPSAEMLWPFRAGGEARKEEIRSLRAGDDESARKGGGKNETG
jgi:hypothetical protein